MQSALAVALIAVGVVLAFAGAELCTRALRSVGRGPLVAMGAVAGALAASAPEFLFAVRAQWDRAPDLAIGLVAGSLIANALLAATLAASGAREPADRATKALGLWTALGVGALLFAAADGVVIALEGGVLLLGALIAAGLAATRREEDGGRPRQTLWMSAAGLLAGVTLLLFGSAVAVDAAVEPPLGFGGGLLFVGLAGFGLAAALPEIAAAGFATRRGEGRMALANVVAGTAITAFGAVGAAALVAPLTVTDGFMGAPAAAMAAAGVGLAVLTLAGGRLPRWAPIAGLVAYAGLMVWLCVSV